MAETKFTQLSSQQPVSTEQENQKKEIDLNGPKKSTENGNFFYNKHTGKICGMPIIFFAFVALIALVLLSLSIFGIFFIFGSGDTTPRLQFHPTLIKGESLIWIDRYKQRRSSPYGLALTNYFNIEYAQTTSDDESLNCAYGGGSATDDKACLIDISRLNTACIKENGNYGYDQGEGTPCILITPSKIVGWEPEPYKTREDLISAKKDGMPDHLVHKIQKYMSESPTNALLDTIWITCEGEHGADSENIGELGYYSPAFKNEEFQGIPSYYFPYNRQINFRMPFIFVKFHNPPYNVTIQIKCKAWAKNIVHKDGYGKVSFSLRID